MNKTENKKRVFARKVATKVALTDQEMQRINGGDTFKLSGPELDPVERKAEHLA